MSEKMEIGSKIKVLREKSGLSQNQIALFLDVDQSYISKCEKGERQFNIEALEKMCNLFGCAFAELFDLDDTPTQSLNFAFRADIIECDDLIAIAEINKIALNISQMKKMLMEA